MAESVEGVLPSEDIQKFSKCLPAFTYAWSFLDRTNFTARCCSRPLGLRGCDSLRSRRKLSDINASAWSRLEHSDSTSIHISTLHTVRTHTHCERAPSCLATRKVKTETEVKKVECLLLCLGRRAVLEQAVHDQLLWLFDGIFESLQEGHKILSDSQGARAWPLTRFSSAKLHFLPVAEKTPWCDSVLGQRKQWLSNSISQWNILTVSKGKKPSILMIPAFKANDTPLEESEAALVLILTVKWQF